MKRHTYPYPRPAVTVDCVTLGWRTQELQLLLIQRDREPFAGSWAFPGGFVDEEEPLEDAARRELREETGIERVTLAPVNAFGNPGRDPRSWTISVAFLALAAPSRRQALAGDDARAVEWFPLASPPRLAFDHARILAEARDRLADLALRAPVAFDMLPRAFTLTDLRSLYEAILQRDLAAPRFTREMSRLQALIDTGKTGRRGARVHRLDRRALRRHWPGGFQLRLVDPI